MLDSPVSGYAKRLQTRLARVLNMAGLVGMQNRSTAGVREWGQCWVVVQRSCEGGTRGSRWICVEIRIELGEVSMRVQPLNQRDSNV